MRPVGQSGSSAHEPCAPDATDPMTKVLAWLGYAALGVAAFLNASRRRSWW